MPAFESAREVLSFDKERISKEELVRTIRYFIAAEYEAVQLYTQVAEKTDDELARAVLLDIAQEELVHAGEFLRLLKEISPDEWEKYQEGFEEVEEMIEKIKKE